MPYYFPLGCSIKIAELFSLIILVTKIICLVSIQYKVTFLLVIGQPKTLPFEPFILSIISFVYIIRLFLFRANFYLSFIYLSVVLPFFGFLLFAIYIVFILL